ncbi:hypothetical protein [Streptomyces sp. enrichment culture]|uniref:hypothetical protein n=1 Tax=Streptomyces sp. enrichment culture TaxID=1795815 RepID=UPI003F546425
MKHRGRHRRRRRGRALRAFLSGTALALTAAATMISVSQASVDEDPGPLEPLTAADARLTEELVPARTLDRLASAMGRPVGVAALLADADRTLRPAAECSSADRAALPVGPAPTRVHCWDAADTGGLRAAAVSTSGDADDDGRWGGHRVVVSGWSGTAGPAGAGRPQATAGRTFDGRTRSGSAAADTADHTDAGPDASDGRPQDGPRLARVSFVDAGDTAAHASGHLPYTSALLTVPVDGGRNYAPLVSDLSGLVWYQDKLLVTAEDALYVYDVNRIQRANVTAPAVGRVPGGWSAHGLRYVLPAVGSYRLDADGTRLGALSLDRSTAPDSLVATERTEEDGGTGTRLWRYSFDTDPARPGLLATDTVGRVTPDAMYRTKVSDVRGVLSHRSHWYVTRADRDGPGTLWRQDTEGAQVARCGTDLSSRCWSGTTASLSYAAGTGEVWAQSGRTLFAVELAEIDEALD